MFDLKLPEEAAAETVVVDIYDATAPIPPVPKGPKDRPTQALLSEAVFDPSLAHRFRLTRWLTSPSVAERTVPRYSYRTLHAILCNPSTATAYYNDGTLAWLERWCRHWNYDAYTVTNAFSFRARNPAAMQAVPEPNHPLNDRFITHALRTAETTVCGWSDHSNHRNRPAELRALCQGYPLWVWRINKSGLPAHPIYLPVQTPLQKWSEQS